MEEREETEESRPACNKLVRKGGGSGKILGAGRKPSRVDPNVMEKSASQTVQGIENREVECKTLIKKKQVEVEEEDHQGLILM